MPVGGSGQGYDMPAVSSMMSRPDASNTENMEDEAALVDSFFLPGGLFSDEGNGSNESNIVNDNNDSKPSRLPLHLPSNPWETGNSSTITPHMTTDSNIGSLSMRSANQRNPEHYSESVQNVYNEVAPSNTNHFPLNRQFRDEHVSNALGIPSAGNDRFHSIPDLIFPNSTQTQHPNVNSTVPLVPSAYSSRVLRPPPGFQDGPAPSRSFDTTESKPNEHLAMANDPCDRDSMDFLASKSTSADHELSIIPPSEERRKTRTDENHLDTSDSTSNQSSLPSNHAITIDEQIGETMNTISHNVRIDKPDDSKGNDNLEGKLLSETTPDCSREPRETNQAAMISVANVSKASSEVSKDSTEDEYGDEDADADVQEEDDDLEENSIPSFVCISISGQSNSSSLSTFSQVENAESSSSHESVHNIDDTDPRDETIGYDTDQAHVSKVANVIGNSLCSSNNQISKQGRSPSVNSAEGTTNIPAQTNNFVLDDDSKSKLDREMLVALLHSAVENLERIMDHSMSAVRKLMSYIQTTKRYKRFARHMELLSQDFQSIRNWLLDVTEALVVLLTHLLTASKKHSRGIVEAATIILSFLRELLKYSIIEALEELRGVTSCYMVLYLMPKTCVALMDYINLPHWTPHTATWLAIFSLCQQVEAGRLHETSNIPISSLLRKLVVDSSLLAPATIANDTIFSKSFDTKLPPPRQQQDELSRAKDMHVCFLLLKTIKTVLPVLYMVEGFSSDFGSIVGANSTSLLTMAFALSVLRKSIISSPIAWVSWAFQVLLGALIPSCLFLDMLVLLIGLSSIRLIRFLDAQRKLEAQERSKK